MLIEPPDLHDFLLAGGAMPRIEGLVHQREPIVRPHITVGCACRRDGPGLSLISLRWHRVRRGARYGAGVAGSNRADTSVRDSRPCAL